MKVKSRRIITVSIISVILLLSAVVLIPKFFRAPRTYHGNYESHKDDFATVKDCVLELSFEEEMRLYIASSANALLDSERNEYIPIPEYVASSLKNIHMDGFGEAYSCDMIIVFEGSVSFASSEYGHYSVVYSPNGRPTVCAHTKNDVSVFDVEHIEGDWYEIWY